MSTDCKDMIFVIVETINTETAWRSGTPCSARSLVYSWIQDPFLNHQWGDWQGLPNDDFFPRPLQLGFEGVL